MVMGFVISKGSVNSAITPWVICIEDTPNFKRRNVLLNLHSLLYLMGQHACVRTVLLIKCFLEWY